MTKTSRPSIAVLGRAHGGGHLIVAEDKALKNLREAGLKLEKPYDWSLSAVGFAKDGKLRVKVEGEALRGGANVVRQGTCPIALIGRS